MSDSPTVDCPSCGKTIVWSMQATYRPFCSKRCYELDLGDWLTESHRIPGPAVDPLAHRHDDDSED